MNISYAGSPFGFDTGLAELGGWLAFVLSVLILLGLVLGVISLVPFYFTLLAGEFTLFLTQNFGRGFKFLLISFRGLRRNLLRTSLTYLATFVLTFVICVIWSVLTFIDLVTTERETDFKAIVTERYQAPSQMPSKYEGDIVEAIKSLPEHLRPANVEDNVMTWSFIGGSTDPKVRSMENIIFFFALEPKKLLTMQYEPGELTEADVESLRTHIKTMEDNPRCVMVGPDKLKAMNKRVGDRIKVYTLGIVDIEFEVEIIGELPGDRMSSSAVMNRAYYYQSLQDYERRTGKKHPLEEGNGRTLNLVWIKLPNKEAFEAAAALVNDPAKFSAPAIKMETASSAVGSFLEAYRDILWGARYLFLPAVAITMSLVVANAISISVRERRTELAVLKVLGFQPWQLLLLVLSEALMVGALSGMISTGLAYYMVNIVGGGIKFPIAFFPKFMIRDSVLWLGPLLGMVTSLVGSLLPAISACRVKASNVFAKVS